MSDITCVRVNAGAVQPASGYPTDFEFYSKAGGAAVFAFRSLLTGGPAFGVLDSITAYAGGGQTNATALASGGQVINRVTTVATGGDSVLLPANTPGAFVIVVNGGGGNSMNVFPQGSAAINAVSGGSAFAVAQNARVLFFCVSATQWYTLPLTAS